MNIYKVVRDINQVVLPMATEPRHLSAIAVLPACVAFLLAALSPAAFGQAAVGLVGGVTRDSASSKPVAGVQVVAHNVAKGTDRSTVSDAAGIFTFTDLEPGQYEVAATKNGFEKSSAQVDVAALRTVRVELPLQIAADVRRAADKSDKPLTDRERQLLERIDRLEERLAAMEVKQEGTANTKTAPEADAKAAPEREVLTASLSPVAVATARPTPAAPFPGSLPAPAPAAAAANQAPDAAAAAPAAAPAVDLQTPFADWNWDWLNGNSRQHDSPLDSKYFSGEFRADTFYDDDFNQPIDHSMGGSSEVFRNGEFQLEDLSIGGDFHAGNMRGRVLALFGMFAATTRAQRRQLRSRPVGCPRRLQIRIGSVRRIPLQRAARPQCRCRYLRFVRRPVQLSQLR